MTLEASIRHPHIRLFFDAWQKARDGRAAAPPRRNFDPLDCAPALRGLFIWEVADDAGFRCVLAGEDLSSAWQTQMRGRTLAEIIGSDEYRIVEERLNNVVGKNLIVHGVYQSVNKHHMIAERLFAPMTNPAGENHYVIGASVFNVTKDDADLLGRTFGPHYYDLSFNRVEPG